jgi:hypothetical protein
MLSCLGTSVSWTRRRTWVEVVLVDGSWREVFLEIAKESNLLVLDDDSARESGQSQLWLAGVESNEIDRRFNRIYKCMYLTRP